ncbi:MULTISPECIES: histidinol-phosphatase [unclassified Lentimicrobium]|uniref:histidinol-phosphatase n=1 Tax=unclassified Lentimicrobium TaxID=2677434 RepID=UPI0015538129|nr:MULTISPECIES: histidinol-phosphatase [unclassified Lentimicrobium]NPD47552.1 histidinol-phosphatase [Lentimicrobium sp. S6]NPD86357.1 histidinol-phosphatase [Lentimicrobium sp. L6]
MIYSNFHTHSIYSDGKAEMKAYCEKAIELGFHSLGFSDHAPVKFDNSFSIPIEKLEEYFQQVELMKETYKDKLHIFTSLEADFIPGKSYDFDFFRQKAKMDYIIGSIHLVYHKTKDLTWFIDGGDQQIWDKGLADIFDGDIKKGVTCFYEQNIEMIEEHKPEVVGHLDKIKMHNKERLFSTKDKWYQDLVEACLTSMKRQGSILEVNTRGIYKGRCQELFPSPEVALKAQKMAIPILLSSDAHHPDELNGAYDSVIETLKNSGIKELVEFSIDGWKSNPLV